MDLVNAVDILLHASVSEISIAPDPWASVALALSQLENTNMLKTLANKDHFDESTLQTAFETGSDVALCELLRGHKSWIRRNIDKIIGDALKMGNSRLVLALQNEFGESVDLNHCRPRLIHAIAQNGSTSLSDSVWDVLNLDVDARSEGRTPLHTAAISGHFLLVPKLLSSGLEGILKANLQDSSKCSPLLPAASAGHFTISKQLIAAGANPNLSNDDKQTPLQVASAKDYLDIVEVLLSQGAKVESQDKQGRIALHWALYNGHTKICLAILQKIKTLAERQPANPWDFMLSYIKRDAYNDRRSNTALETAEMNDAAGIAGLTLARATNEEAAAASRAKPNFLLGDTSSVNFDIILSSVNVIVLTSVDSFGVDTKDEGGITPLYLAIRRNYVSMVKALLELGANVDRVDHYGRKPLHYAARHGFYDVVLELFAAPDVEISPKDENGDTPLHFAASWGHVPVLKKLLEKDAKSDSENYENAIPLVDACINGRVEAVKLLLPHASSNHLDDAYFQSSDTYGTRVEIVKLLLEAGANIDLVKATGTALHRAAWKSEPQLVYLLLIKRASLELRDEVKRTPLLYAATRGAVECVRLLVDAGADVNAEDRNGNTPLLEAATEDYTEDYTSCIRILIAAKAEPKISSRMSDRYNSYAELALFDFSLEAFRIVLDQASAGWTSHVSSKLLRKYVKSNICNVGKISILLDKGLDPDQ